VRRCGPPGGGGDGPSGGDVTATGSRQAPSTQACGVAGRGGVQRKVVAVV